MRQLLIALACTCAAACAPTPRGGEIADELAATITTMNVVAHEDDDILFMNNDVRRDLARGRRVVSVYLTAGEADGSGVHSTFYRTRPPTCAITGTDVPRETFAAHRQSAAMAAYANMLGGTTWSMAALLVNGSKTVEVATSANGKAVLVFVNLPDGGDGACDDGSFTCSVVNGAAEETCPAGVPRAYALNNLFELPTFAMHTLVVDNGSPLRTRQSYQHADVVSVLSGLMSLYQPSVVRTLDPQPNPALNGDNPDHGDAAKFTDETLAVYHGPAGNRRDAVHYYVGYGLGYKLNGDDHYLPANLGYQDTTDKQTTGDIYGGLDDNYPQGYQAYQQWYSRTYPRQPSGVRWVERTSAGTLAAFAVEDRQVVMWAEAWVGGQWTGPTTLPSSQPMAPGVTVARRPDGLLQLFALRLPLADEHENRAPGAPLHDVVTAIQGPPSPLVGAPPQFGAWQSLGTPMATSCDSSDQSGASAGEVTGAVDGRGRQFVFVRDGVGQPVYRMIDGATMTPWQALACDATIGPGILEGIAAVTRDNGNIEVFFTTATGQIMHFVEVDSGALLDSGAFPAAGPITDAASPPTAALNQDGRLEIFYREAGTARVKTTWETPLGPWAAPGLLYGDAGTGDVAAIRRGGTGEILLFERNVWGGVSQTQQTAPNSGFSWWQWQILAGSTDELPTATTDGAGRVVLLVKGEAGELDMRRETSSGTVGVFDPWTTVGGYKPISPIGLGGVTTLGP